MNENEYKKQFCGTLSSYGFDVQFHEDSYERFIPDVSFAFAGTDGWIEFKYAHKPPKTLGGIKHYTRGQELWLRTRGKVGSGLCYLVLGTSQGVVIWDWSTLKVIRDMPTHMAVTHAVHMSETPETGAAWLRRIVLQRGSYSGSRPPAVQHHG